MHEETAISLLGRNESFLSSCGACDGLPAAAARSLANGPNAYPAGRALASRHRARPRRRCAGRHHAGPLAPVHALHLARPPVSAGPGHAGPLGQLVANDFSII